MDGGAMRAVIFGLWGLVFGSFLTVVVHRMPRRESIVAPRSSCPVCGVPIRSRDNIPVVSYLILRGRCRSCHTPVSAEYPIVEGLTAALFVGTALAVRDTAVVAVVAPFLGVLLAAGVIDLRHRMIPNRLTYPSIVVFGAAVATVSLLGGPLSLGRGLVGLVAFGGGLLLVALISPAGMGMGDVKLAALIGLVLGALGWSHLAVGALVALLAGGVGGVVALAVGRGRKDTIPFGPYLAGGATLAVLAGPAVAGWYSGLLL